MDSRANEAGDDLRLNKTQEGLLRYIAGETAVNGGASCTKRELAERFRKNVKTIDRNIAFLRQRGLVEVEMRFNERGAQVGSIYRAPGAPSPGDGNAELRALRRDSLRRVNCHGKEGT
ncbi:MAG TPA: hypothetical protein IAA22_08380 [Candidatus Olsenella stercoravium]|uniref:Helix-turn-helix type 11 domain-containing protein n=1 Tax=Candidatus Olsenella stercoravium TaxID=2838713 RepID=A0A9D2DL92_9ACTN|nr:hypothetical protein [Candidatus Olsenella stercoravium]